MWLEAMALMSSIACVMIGIVLSAILFVAPLFGFLLIVAITLVIFGNIIIGYQITRNHLKWLIDPLAPSEELCVLFDHSGNIDFVRTVKGPHDTRLFMRYNKSATIINTGDYQIRTHNGNKGFVGHEDIEVNVNLIETEALDKTKGDNIKDIYYRLTHLKRKKEVHANG